MKVGRHSDVGEWILLDAARGGDERAFGILLERHRPGLEKVCCLMLGDPQHAEHAMQEAVLTAWRERGLAARSSPVRMWLYRIAVRVCLEARGACDEFQRREAFDGVNRHEESDRL
jgi:DNA-directed RNA polymerase specialized sigma24 family protein